MSRPIPHEPPAVRIDGVPISAGPDVVSVVGGIEITWGNDSILDEPRPATARFGLLWTGAVNADVMQIGLRVDITQTLGPTVNSLFGGRIESMRARRDGRGRLIVEVTAVDFMKELKAEYLEVDWPADNPGAPDYMPRIERINYAFRTAGWTLSGRDRLPDAAPLGAATHYNSITLWTILRRWLAWWGPQVSMWDASSIDAGGVWTRRTEIGYMGAVTTGDVLTTDAAGRWEVSYAAPSPLPAAVVPASTVLADVEWTASPDNRYTGARVHYQTTRSEATDDGSTRLVTSLTPVQTYRPQDVLDRYGVRLLEIETSALTTPAEHRRAGRRWLDFATGDWRMGAVTVRRASQLPRDQLARMLQTRDRRLTWWVIAGVDVVTPLGGVSTIRGSATGGRMTYDPLTGWEISMHLTDTRTAAPSDLPWTFLSEHPDPRFEAAPTTAAGEVTFADFTTITETR